MLLLDGSSITRCCCLSFTFHDLRIMPIKPYCCIFLISWHTPQQLSCGVLSTLRHLAFTVCYTACFRFSLHSMRASSARYVTCGSSTNQLSTVTTTLCTRRMSLTPTPNTIARSAVRSTRRLRICGCIRPRHTALASRLQRRRLRVSSVTQCTRTSARWSGMFRRCMKSKCRDLPLCYQSVDNTCTATYV